MTVKRKAKAHAEGVYWFMMDSDWRRNTDLEEWYQAQDILAVQEKMVRTSPKPLVYTPTPMPTPEGYVGHVYADEDMTTTMQMWLALPSHECLTMTDEKLATVFGGLFKRLIVAQWIEHPNGEG